jgi:hypothetical protein
MSDTPPSFAVGDRVTFTSVTSRGSSISIREIEGTIVDLGSVNAVIKMRNGKRKVVNLKKVTKDGDENGTTRVFKGFCKAVSDSQPQPTEGQ